MARQKVEDEVSEFVAEASRLRRDGAALILGLGDGGVDACIELATALDGRLLALARDADLYAVVARGQSPMASRSMRGAVVQHLEARIWELECFSKPLVTLLSGSPSSAALAIAMAGTHRVAGDAFACEIADVRRGSVPPGVLMHTLSRLPDGIGTYLMLTGCIIGAPDALGLGFVTHCVSDNQFDAITTALANADPVDPVLDDRHTVAGDSALEPLLELIVRHFAANDVDSIVASLARETGSHRLWAANTAVQIAQVPTAAARAALAVLEQAKPLDIRETTIITARANALLVTPAAGRLSAAQWAARVSQATADDMVLALRAELQSLRRPASTSPTPTAAAPGRPEQAAPGATPSAAPPTEG